MSRRSDTHRARKAHKYADELPEDFVPVSEDEYQSMIKGAISLDGPKGHYGEFPPMETMQRAGGNKMTRTVHRRVEIPTEVEKQVEIERDVVKRAVEKQTVKGVKMVKKTGHKTVTDVEVEVKEEVVHGYRTVWKPVKEPCTHIVKRPVKKEVKREVPYTYYEPEEVSYEIEVPREKVTKERGFRTDKVVVGKMVDVERDELYEMRPHYIGTGPARMKHKGSRVLARNVNDHTGRAVGNNRSPRAAAPQRSPESRPGSVRSKQPNHYPERGGGAYPVPGGARSTVPKIPKGRVAGPRPDFYKQFC
eukprot:TRINITY_DN9424_c0_g1_i1.p1 TRINITY_DN9424_c0_g1~~TRINITY_DN9424_c0_g1_i1.p1  ORF type:complete len:305 (-),score=58.55 TRINITY_DN9424_c0_g1_i1:258-1172(-)